MLHYIIATLAILSLGIVPVLADPAHCEVDFVSSDCTNSHFDSARPGHTTTFVEFELEQQPEMCDLSLYEPALKAVIGVWVPHACPEQGWLAVFGRDSFDTCDYDKEEPVFVDLSQEGCTMFDFGGSDIENIDVKKAFQYTDPGTHRLRKVSDRPEAT